MIDKISDQSSMNVFTRIQKVYFFYSERLVLKLMASYNSITHINT